MNAKNLSDRLKTVASYVEKNTILADIGSDHAYLPCYLVHQSTIKKAIAGEVVKGPYESALKQVKNEGLENQIEVRFGDGLQVINEEDHIGTITIAGMGGPLIAAILEAGKHKLTNVHTLILQPNIHAKAIREWAVKEGWKIEEETILEEHSKIYEVIVLKKGSMTLTEQELLVGPILMQVRTNIFKKKWSVEVKEWERIWKQLKTIPNSTEVEHKIKELENKMSIVKELL